MKIVIVDSGISNVVKFKNITVKSFNFTDSDIDEDENGHGTAVASIIARINSDCELYMLKIYKKELSVDEKMLIDALEFIDNNIPCDILHLSLGTSLFSTKLYQLCYRIYNKGALLVSSFANEGYMSYPAAFSFVIGVDSSDECKKTTDFDISENDESIVRAKGGIHRTLGLSSDNVIHMGSSMSAAYVTGYLSLNKYKSIHEAVNFLKNMSTFEKKEFDYRLYCNKYDFTVRDYKKIAIFPFNKEVHSILNFNGLTSYNLNLFTSKYDINLHKYVKGLFSPKEYYLHNLDELSFENCDFDLFVIAHTTEIQHLLKKDYKFYILQKCLEKGIDVFCFDNYSLYDFPEKFLKRNLRLFVPDSVENTKKNSGKLYQYKTPIVGVFGTSSHQGKFTLQMQLRNLLSSMDYNVGHFSTEPSGPLLGATATYTIGYNSNKYTNEYEFVNSINYLMHKIDERNFDLIIVGSQSNTICENLFHVGHLPIKQIMLLLASMPDYVVLCVNPNDSFEYIYQTINVIESIGNTKVLALGIYPFVFNNGWHYSNKIESKISKKDMKDLKRKYLSFFNLSSYVIGDNEDIQLLANKLIDSFC